MKKHRVNTDFFHSRAGTKGENSSVVFRKGDVLPEECVKRYSEKQIASHIKEGRILVEQDVLENKKMPEAGKKDIK